MMRISESLASQVAPNVSLYLDYSLFDVLRFAVLVGDCRRRLSDQLGRFFRRRWHFASDDPSDRIRVDQSARAADRYCLLFIYIVTLWVIVLIVSFVRLGFRRFNRLCCGLNIGSDFVVVVVSSCFGCRRCRRRRRCIVVVA